MRWVGKLLLGLVLVMGLAYGWQAALALLVMLIGAAVALAVAMVGGLIAVTILGGPCLLALLVGFSLGSD